MRYVQGARRRLMAAAAIFAVLDPRAFAPSLLASSGSRNLFPGISKNRRFGRDQAGKPRYLNARERDSAKRFYTDGELGLDAWSAGP